MHEVLDLLRGAGEARGSFLHAMLQVAVLLLETDRRLRETHIRPLQLIRQCTGDPRHTEQKYTTDDQAEDLSCDWEPIAPDLGVGMNEPRLLKGHK